MSDKIRTLRKQHKMTQLALAQRAGLSESQISKYETGRRQPDRDAQWKIAGAFSVMIEDVFPDADITPAPDPFGTL